MPTPSQSQGFDASSPKARLVTSTNLIAKRYAVTKLAAPIDGARVQFRLDGQADHAIVGETMRDGDRWPLTVGWVEVGGGV
jgi:hypothetical protein